MTKNRWGLPKVEIKKLVRHGAWALACVCLLPLAGLAGMQFNADERIVVPTQNQMADSWYAAAQEMNITGHLMQSSFLAASQLTFAGVADQDLNMAFQIGTLSGIVGQDLRVVGDMVKISTRVGQNLVVVGRDVHVEVNALVKDGLAVAGKKVLISGTVQGKTDVVGENVQIDGTLLGDVVVRTKTFTLGPNARISGTLTYSADKVVDLPAGVAAAQTKRLDAAPSSSGNEWYTLFGKVAADKLFSLLFSATFLIVCLLLIWAWPGAAQRYGEAVSRSVWGSLGWGLLLLVGVPIAVILLTVSIVGIPLALLMTVVYLMGLFFSKLGVSCWLGGLVLFQMKHKKVMVTFLVGYAVLVVVGLIPILGTMVNWLAMIIGLGALVMVRRAAVPVTAPVPVAAVDMIPTPVAPSTPAPSVLPVAVPQPAAVAKSAAKVVIPKRPMAGVKVRTSGTRKAAPAKAAVRKPATKKAVKPAAKRSKR